MMQVLVYFALLVVVYSARLDNQYLPPNSRQAFTPNSQLSSPRREYIPANRINGQSQYNSQRSSPAIHSLSSNNQFPGASSQTFAPNGQYPSQFSSGHNFGSPSGGSTRQYVTPSSSSAFNRQYQSPGFQQTPSNVYGSPQQNKPFGPGRQSAYPSFGNTAQNRQYIAPSTQYPTGNSQYSAPAFGVQNANARYPSNQFPDSASKSFDVGNQYRSPSHQQSSPDFNGQYARDQISPVSNRQVPILRSENNPNAGDGSYRYAYETADGISADEEGNHAGARGGFSYTSPEGEQVSLRYTADENGFHPQGSHVPNSEAIEKSIQRNLAEETRSGQRGDQYSGPGYDSVSIEANPVGGYKY